MRRVFLHTNAHIIVPCGRGPPPDAPVHLLGAAPFDAAPRLVNTAVSPARRETQLRRPAVRRRRLRRQRRKKKCTVRRQNTLCFFTRGYTVYQYETLYFTLYSTLYSLLRTCALHCAPRTRPSMLVRRLVNMRHVGAGVEMDTCRSMIAFLTPGSASQREQGPWDAVRGEEGLAVVVSSSPCDAGRADLRWRGRKQEHQHRRWCLCLVEREGGGKPTEPVSSPPHYSTTTTTIGHCVRHTMCSPYYCRNV